MRTRAMMAGTALTLCLWLTGCLTAREHVLAPSSGGVVVDVATGRPVEGALVVYAGLEGAVPVATGPDGSFTLDGRTDRRAAVVLPVSGVFRDATRVRVTARGMADAYGSAAFINAGAPARALYKVTVLMFPADVKETPLHALTRDCMRGPEQMHALHVADYLAGLDPDRPPEWLDPGTAEALYEHLWLVLPAPGFQSCGQMTAAYETFLAQTDRLRAIARSGPDPSRP